MGEISNLRLKCKSNMLLYVSKLLSKLKRFTTLALIEFWVQYRSHQAQFKGASIKLISHSPLQDSLFLFNPLDGTAALLFFLFEPLLYEMLLKKKACRYIKYCPNNCLT